MAKNEHKIGFFFKWCFDRVMALIGLIVLFLPLLLIAILIKTIRMIGLAHPVDHRLLHDGLDR